MPKVPVYSKQPVKPPRPLNNIEATAKAWGISNGEMYQIWGWVEDKVPEYRRWRALRTILQKHHHTQLKRPKQQKLL